MLYTVSILHLTDDGEEIEAGAPLQVPDEDIEDFKRAAYDMLAKRQATFPPGRPAPNFLRIADPSGRVFFRLVLTPS